jgi:hypothetical protein
VDTKVHNFLFAVCAILHSVQFYTGNNIAYYAILPAAVQCVHPLALSVPRAGDRIAMSIALDRPDARILERTVDGGVGKTKTPIMPCQSERMSPLFTILLSVRNRPAQPSASNTIAKLLL